MPRTKVVRKKATAKPCDYAAVNTPILQSNFALIRHTLEQEQSQFLHKFHLNLKQSKLSIPKAALEMTVAELMDLPLNWSWNSTILSTQVLDGTRTLTKGKQRGMTRSSSTGDDEGYRTTESTNSTSDARVSRSRDRKPKEKKGRVSRSLSRQKQAEKYKTPANSKKQLTSYGMITPKVKPNTPQVLLRRPKLGEVVLSLQGSPLMTGNVISDNIANINIPLDDGRFLSIQPERGLRMSQIPVLDTETKRQLETLRDNLNKVCAFSTKR